MNTQMKAYNYSSQSYKLLSYRVVVDDAVEITQNRVHNVHLGKRYAAVNLVEYTVTPGGEFHGVLVDHYAGRVSGRGGAIIALASTGNWSGGSNLRGWVFGKPGAVVIFNRKGTKKWYVVTEAGISVTDVEPETIPAEL